MTHFKFEINKLLLTSCNKIKIPPEAARVRRGERYKVCFIFETKVRLKWQFSVEADVFPYCRWKKHAESLFWHSVAGLSVSGIITSAACLPQTTFKWKQDEPRTPLVPNWKGDVDSRPVVLLDLCRFASCRWGRLHVLQRMITRHPMNASCVQITAPNTQHSVTLLVRNQTTTWADASATPSVYSRSEMTRDDQQAFCAESPSSPPQISVRNSSSSMSVKYLIFCCGLCV